MARINQLVNSSTLNATDVLAIDAASGGTTNKITAANLASGIKTIGSLVNTTEMNAAIEQSTATKDIGSLFTDRDSHVSRLNARLSGKMVTLSCTINAGVANGAKLFDIAPSIEPSFGDWIAPLIKGSGELVTYGTAWIYRTQNLQATYYGSQATNAELTFDLCYLAK